MTRYGRVEPLSSDHETADFDCGSEAQTSWLRRHAIQASRSDTCKVYVVCHAAMRRVVGYYSIAAGAVSHDSAPPRVTRGLGRYPVPVILLARLGVDVAEQGRGLGSALVRDALLQTASIAENVGVRALLIHAETPEAAEFYRRVSPAFEPSPTAPLDLILLMKDLRTAIREASLSSRRLTLSRPPNKERGRGAWPSRP